MLSLCTTIQSQGMRRASVTVVLSRAFARHLARAPRRSPQALAVVPYPIDLRFQSAEIRLQADPGQSCVFSIAV